MAYLVSLCCKTQKFCIFMLNNLEILIKSCIFASLLAKKTTIVVVK